MNISLPFRMIVSAPSQSGKTTFVVKFLHHLPKWTGQDVRVLWCMAEENAAPNDLPQNSQLFYGIPNFDEIETEGKTIVVVLDDLQFEAGKDDSCATLFTRKSHHLGISVILVTQNPFFRSKYSRDMSLNANLLCVLPNKRDPSQFFHLCRQVYPKNPKALLDVYDEIMNEPYSHLLLDLGQETNRFVRFKTKIFDQYPIVFAPIPSNTDVYPI